MGTLTQPEGSILSQGLECRKSSRRPRIAPISFSPHPEEILTTSYVRDASDPSVRRSGVSFRRCGNVDWHALVAGTGCAGRRGVARRESLRPRIRPNEFVLGGEWHRCGLRCLRMPSRSGSDVPDAPRPRSIEQPRWQPLLCVRERRSVARECRFAAWTSRSSHDGGAAVTCATGRGQLLHHADCNSSRHHRRTLNRRRPVSNVPSVSRRDPARSSARAIPLPVDPSPRADGVRLGS